MPAAKVLVKHVIGDEAVSKLNSVRCQIIQYSGVLQKWLLISKNKSLRKYRDQNMDLPYNWSNQPTCQTTHSFWSRCVMLLKMQFEVNYY